LQVNRCGKFFTRLAALQNPSGEMLEACRNTRPHAYRLFLQPDHRPPITSS
jgi:hypothetical protein